MSLLLEAADGVEALPLDPFGAHPQWASRIAGLGGQDAAPDPAYLFETGDSRPALGLNKAVVRFHDLAMSHGTLLFEVRVRSAVPGAEQVRLKTIPLGGDELIAAGGVVELEFESYRNAFYAISCAINGDTDIAASGLSVALDRQAAPDHHARAWDWPAGQKAGRRPGIEAALVSRVLTDLDLPTLELPQSQVGTPQQCREPAFNRAMKALHRDPVGSFENWSLAYVLRAIDRFAGDGPQRMMGFGDAQAPLLSYFAGQGNEVVGMRHAIDPPPLDPGRELETMRIPQLCSEQDYFDNVHLTVEDVRQTNPILHGRFDILWSIGVNRLMTQAEFVYFVVNGLAHAKPGGLAVHVFDYLEDHDGERGDSLTRHDIERMAVLALSHYNDVARLRFVHCIETPAQGAFLPFGIVLMRGGWQEG